MFLVTHFLGLVAGERHSARGGGGGNEPAWSALDTPPPLVYQFWRAHAASKAEYMHHCDSALAPLGVTSVMLPVMQHLPEIEGCSAEVHARAPMVEKISEVFHADVLAPSVGPSQGGTPRAHALLGARRVFGMTSMADVQPACSSELIRQLDMYFNSCAWEYYG